MPSRAAEVVRMPRVKANTCKEFHVADSPWLIICVDGARAGELPFLSGAFGPLRGNLLLDFASSRSELRSRDVCGPPRSPCRRTEPNGRPSRVSSRRDFHLERLLMVLLPLGSSGNLSRPRMGLRRTGLYKVNMPSRCAGPLGAGVNRVPEPASACTGHGKSLPYRHSFAQEHEPTTSVLRRPERSTSASGPRTLRTPLRGYLDRAGGTNSPSAWVSFRFPQGPRARLGTAC
jgi:hypothetical protein